MIHAAGPTARPAATPEAPRYRWVPVAPVDADAVRGLAAEVGCSRVLGELMLGRGIRDPETARSFLEPQLQGLHPPEELPDIDRGVERVRRALASGQRICVYGDYDVDGITGTALLVELFRHLGREIDTYIPHRVREGYGLNAEAIRTIAARETQLLITVDGGSNDLAELELARRLGMDVIVTDHHPIRGALPDVPVIHPGREDNPSSFAGLSGVGVAYKFVWALGKSLSGSQRVTPAYREFMLSALGYVALGTVADVVPLVEENRILVNYGLRALSRLERPGLRSLFDECRVRPGQVSAQDIGFRLAPHLNAAGRVGSAEDALRLLLTQDPDEGRDLAQSLGRANRERRQIERQMLEECEESLARDPHLERGGILVFAKEGWHSGVAGIVASRLVDRFARPAFVICLKDGLGRGSGRSLPDRPLTHAYEAVREVSQSVGGHACAGGVTVEAHRIAEFRNALFSAFPPEASPRAPALAIDATLDPRHVSAEFAEELTRLEPFGHGNPVPRFRFDGLELVGRPRLVGQQEEHLSFFVRSHGTTRRAILFRGAHLALPLREAREISLAAEILHSPEWGPELRVVDVDLR